MKLSDSGARREFESGAVRDISDGKGRCDLLPLDTIEDLISWYEHCNGAWLFDIPTMLGIIDDYVNHGNPSSLYAAFCWFVNLMYKSDIYEAILDVSKQYEDGAKKYAPNNWKLGIPVHCFIDSAIRHYMKSMRGDTDEPHDRAVLWNLVGAIWTHKHHPELNDISPREEGGVDSDK